MFEWIGYVLIGFVSGLAVAQIIYLTREVKEDIKMYQPPVLFSEEKNVVTASAEFSMPETDMLYPVSSKWIESQLSYKLAEEIWKYAMVQMMEDKRNMTLTYRARLKVVDMGQLNPLCSYGERKEEDGQQG